MTPTSVDATSPSTTDSVQEATMSNSLPVPLNSSDDIDSDFEEMSDPN